MYKDELIAILTNCQDDSLNTEELIPFLKNLNKTLSSKGKKLLIQDEKPKQQYPLQLQRFMGVQMGFEKIMQDKDFNGTDYRILHYFLSNMDQKNVLRDSQATIGEKLGIKQQQVGRSIKKLKEKDIIHYKGSKRLGHYVLNPEIAWKGRTDDWYDLVDIAKLMKQNATFLNKENEEDETPTPF